ncbi:MAG: molybdopterin-dependent oxidoreductase, partial [Clostridiales bacterium]|nr:molybdopterin-dependent oxidoreductase [Clostridiales bacterium]
GRMADLAGANGQREGFRVVGKPNLPGIASRALATGEARFGSDFICAGMLHAAFLRSPYANAKVVSINTERAEALEGVALVLTWEDEEIKGLKSHGELFGAPRPFLDNIADREGAEVAAVVVAETEDICEEALRLLDVEWEVYPHVVDIIEGSKPGAPRARQGEGVPPSFHDIKASHTERENVYSATLAAGDIRAGFAEADHIATFRMRIPPFASHMPNPPGSVAWWEDGPSACGGEGLYADGPCVGEGLYTDGPSAGEGEGLYADEPSAGGSKDKNLYIEGVVREKDAISSMYDMPQDRTIQTGLFMGGKYCDWGLRRSQEITPLLARRTGRPVRCFNKREDTYDLIMNERYTWIKAGFTADGLITAVDDFSVADGGVRSSSAFGNIADLMQGPYNTLKCGNIRQAMEVVESNRGMMYVSGQHCPFNWDAVTTAIYLIAEKLGKDPIDIARLNLHGPDSKADADPVPSFEMCVSAGRELMGWEWHATGARRLPDGRLHGASFRYQMSPRHSFTDYHARLELRDGVVHMPTQGPVFGAFAVEANAMAVAEELGLEYGDVSVRLDTREAFKTYGGGADGTAASCWVMKECANILKAKIIGSAIGHVYPGMDPGDLELAGGRVVAKSGRGDGVTLAEATRGETIAAEYSGRPPLALWVTGGMGGKLDTMNTACCEVAVDVETGEVEILRFVVAADTGKILRRTSLESQVDQAMYFSQGCQLFEDYFFDPKTGARLNANMVEYKKPGMLDVPPVEKALLESRAGNAAYGASGISHSLANTNLAIIAIHNATGVWVEPPATPDKVLEALGA